MPDTGIEAEGLLISEEELKAQFSQRTYTLYINGWYERKITLTDGSQYSYEHQFWRVPQRGDVKHREEVWRNNSWVITVNQVY